MHPVFERRVVRQVHAGLNPLPAKDRNRRAIRSDACRSRQKLSKRLLYHRLQRPAVASRVGLGGAQELVVDIYRRPHAQKHIHEYAFPPAQLVVRDIGRV